MTARSRRWHFWPALTSLLLTLIGSVQAATPTPSDQVQSQDPAKATAALRAVRITLDNVAHLQQQGPDAIGGVGDWHLSNGTLCATFSAVEHESDLSTRGGALVDLGYCGRADDQFSSMQDLLNGSTASPVNVHSVKAIQGSSSAAIRTLAGDNGLIVETLYQVDMEQPTRLRIDKRIQRVRDGAPEFFGFVPVLFNYQSLETFVLSTQDLSASTGFVQQRFHDQGAASFGQAARNADTVVAIGSKDAPVPIAYGWQLHRVSKSNHNNSETMLPAFVLSDAGSTVRLIIADTFYLRGSGDLGNLQLLQLPLLGTDVGEVIRSEESLYIGPMDDVDSVLDQMFPNQKQVSGRINHPGAGVHLDLADGTPFNFTRANADGEFSIGAFSEREYRLRIVGHGGITHTQNLRLLDQGVNLGSIELAEPGWLRLPRGEPMRVIVSGRDGTPDPHLQDTFTAARSYIGDTEEDRPKVSAVFLAGIESDSRRVPLAPGSYRVSETRGIEYDVTQYDVQIDAGKTATYNSTPPQRAVQTPGYIAADFHVHSAPSMDNGFAVRERVRTFVAEHAEVMVAAEHENMFDFAPLIQEMGVVDKMIAITGTEMTGQVPSSRMPHSSGHANFFPLTPEPFAYRRGVPANEGRRLRDILYDVRRTAPSAITQINHARENDALLGIAAGTEVDNLPRSPNNGAYFDHMGPAAYPYNPNLPLTSAPNNVLIEPDPVTGIRDIDFDAMEVLNGPHGYQPTRRRALLADWYSLLNQGERIAGTANSDSHNKAQTVGSPRNMVAISNDAIGGFNQEEFLASIRQGNLYGTTGPLLNVSLNDAGLGATVTGASATLKIQVNHANWVPVNEIRVRINGVVTQTLPVPDSGLSEIDLSFEKDSHVTVEVEGEPTKLYQTVFPRQVPYAFTNPIFVDADGDGKWTAPGLQGS